MDFSKVPDSQRQQLEQLQQQFHEHQAQQQKQQQESAAAAAAAATLQQPPPPAYYDSSQVHQSYDPSQAYDQSCYYAYNSNYNYNYQDASQQQQQPQQQYDASYYQNYYANAYQQQAQQYAQPETSTVPSEQQQSEGPGSGSVGLGQGHDPSNQVNFGGTQPNAGNSVPSGLNAAAAAAVTALSQLTHFAGSMSAAERAMGGGGYGPPMAGGGHYDHGQFRPPPGHSPYRGGGRHGGRGNFGFRPPNAGGSGSSFHGRGRGRGRGGRGVEQAKPSDGAEPSGQVNVQPPLRIAWCELCQVDCNSKEILEQHNNGKRHKKNLQRLQDMKGEYQPVGDTEINEKPISDITSETNKNVKGSQTDDQKKPWMKRKMRGGGHGGGRGSKRQRQQGATGPPKPKVVIPLMCDLCNVKCDTQEVFDRHVAGKKHIAKLKRFEGHQAMYGPTAVQALYPPNPLSQTLVPPQPAYYGAPSSYPAPPEAYMPPYPPQNPNPQLADAPLEFGSQNVAQASTGGIQ